MMPYTSRQPVWNIGWLVSFKVSGALSPFSVHDFSRIQFPGELALLGKANSVLEINNGVK